MIDRPYFMTNKDWYKFDFAKRQYVLTDKAPEGAKKSIKKFYAEIDIRNRSRKDD